MEAESAFATIFRHETSRTVEYSVGPDPTKIGTMVGGGDGLIALVRRFLTTIRLGGDWFWGVERFIALVRPDTYLFKTDWSEGVLESITIYCRFPGAVSQLQIEQLLKECQPLQWSGPSVDELSQLFDVTGPRGIGFRLGVNGVTSSALYFRVPVSFRNFKKKGLESLVKLCEFDSSVEEEMRGEMETLYRSGAIGVVGLDSAQAGNPVSLKLDPANIPLRIVRSWLEDHEIRMGYIQQIGTLASNLRAAVATYFGLKFGDHGLSGWKLYLAVKSNELTPAGTIRISGPRELSPAVRMPQY